MGVVARVCACTLVCVWVGGGVGVGAEGMADCVREGCWATAVIPASPWTRHSEQLPPRRAGGGARGLLAPPANPMP